MACERAAPTSCRVRSTFEYSAFSSASATDSSPRAWVMQTLRALPVCDWQAFCAARDFAAMASERALNVGADMVWADANWLNARKRTAAAAVIHTKG